MSTSRRMEVLIARCLVQAERRSCAMSFLLKNNNMIGVIELKNEVINSNLLSTKLLKKKTH
jgi:hypothetical protein